MLYLLNVQILPVVVNNQKILNTLVLFVQFTERSDAIKWEISLFYGFHQSWRIWELKNIVFFKEGLRNVEASIKFLLDLTSVTPKSKTFAELTGKKKKFFLNDRYQRKNIGKNWVQNEKKTTIIYTSNKTHQKQTLSEESFVTIFALEIFETLMNNTSVFRKQILVILFCKKKRILTHT